MNVADILSFELAKRNFFHKSRPLLTAHFQNGLHVPFVLNKNNERR